LDQACGAVVLALNGLLQLVWRDVH
jgi:hypothetical protein